MFDLPNAFILFFKITIGLSDDQFEEFVSCFHKEFVPKKEYYLKEGEITKQKAYVLNGCSRTFIIDESGKEKILFFCFEDWWLGDMESYYTGKPGKQYIQAIEDLELFCISKEDFTKFEERIPQFSKWYQVKLQRSHVATLERLVEAKSKTPDVRYKELLNKHPDIFQRIPLQYIASYLNIEPQSLSRIRHKAAGKG
jgi:CRP-like cAMP-binding protein